MRVLREQVRHRAPEGVVDGPASFELVTVAQPPSRVEVLHVHVDPGPCTRWHTHPLGQTLVVTGGRGRVQSPGGAPQALDVGDVVHLQQGTEHADRAGPGVREPVSAHDHPNEEPT